jgi:hypothetical protein
MHSLRGSVVMMSGGGHFKSGRRLRSTSMSGGIRDTLIIAGPQRRTATAAAILPATVSPRRKASRAVTERYCEVFVRVTT